MKSKIQLLIALVIGISIGSIATYILGGEQLKDQKVEVASEYALVEIHHLIENYKTEGDSSNIKKLLARNYNQVVMAKKRYGVQVWQQGDLNVLCLSREILEHKRNIFGCRNWHIEPLRVNNSKQQGPSGGTQ